MINYLRYALLLLITLYCTSYGTLCVMDTTNVKGPVELFGSTYIDNVLDPQNSNANKGQNAGIFHYFYYPFFVAADNVLVAVTSVNSYYSNLKYIPDILTRYIETTSDDWVNKIMRNNSNSWTTQFALQAEENATKRNVAFIGFAAASCDNKIYLLALNISNTRNTDGYNSFYQFKLLVGTVAIKENPKLQIKWNADTSFETWLDKELNDRKLVPFSFGHYVFSVGNGGYLLVVRATSEDQTLPKKRHFVFVYVKGTERKLNVLSVDDECFTRYYFFYWEKELIMYTQCDIRSPEMKKSSDMGESWSNGSASFNHLWKFMKNKNDFTTATIDDTPVLLFTQTMLIGDCAVRNVPQRYDTYLWMSDGYRVYRVGNVAPDNEFGTFKSMVVSNGHLFALYEDSVNNGSIKPFMMHLNKELMEIKTALRSWSNTNALMQALCKSNTATKTFCHTDGLVGFLSNTSEGDSTEWKDEYQCVNATITKNNGAVAKKVANGFKFNGHAGAKWPVGAPKEGQRYNFIINGFTLVATVRIDGAGEKDNSLLGAVIGSGEYKHGVGLRCDKEGRFGVIAGEESLKADNEKRCERGKTYDVALILKQEGTIAVHVDWEPITNLPEHLKKRMLPNILHFYFGADNDHNNVESHVTVRNVLLYNRPFTDDEIKELKINVKALKKSMPAGGSNPYSFDEDEEETSILEGIVKENAVLRVLFLLFCVFFCAHLQYY